MKRNISALGAATTVQNIAARLWTTHEVAEAIRFHVESVRRACRQGRIKTVRFGRELRIADAEAQRILREGLPS